jgi:hypothetical protein
MHRMQLAIILLEMGADISLKTKKQGSSVLSIALLREVECPYRIKFLEEFKMTLIDYLLYWTEKEHVRR